MKKIISLIISVIMILGMIPLSVSAVTTLSIVQIGDIKAPVPGFTPDYDATYGTGYNFTTELDQDGQYMCYGVTWVDETAGRTLSTDDTFIDGHVYRVAVIVKAQPGYQFSRVDNYTTNIAGGINGKQGQTYVVSGWFAGEYVGVTYTFESCSYTRVSSVKITDLTVPASGGKFDFEATPADSTYKITNIFWKDLTTGLFMDEDDVAVAGHQYEVEIWVLVNNGYRFKLDNNDYLDITAKIGAYNATVAESFSDMSATISDRYIVPDDITTVTVSGIDAPVNGATADTTASCGSGYKIKEIVWVDSTGEYSEWEYGITQFKPGRVYTVQVALETISNYRFVMDGPYNDVKGKLNGNTAIVYGSHSSTEVTIGYEFGATEKEIISSVSLTDIAAPVTGATPDTEITCSDGVKITKVDWVDTTGEYADYVHGITKFEPERKYTVQVTVETLDGYEYRMDMGYTDITGTVNGNTATVYGSHSETEVTIGYEFNATEKEIISSVALTDIDAPVTGATADTTVTVGDGYKVKEIVWVDTTGEYAEWEYGITEFKPGRKYTVQVALETLDGYEFLVVGGYNEVTGTVNGNTATVYGSHSETEVTVGYEFPATEMAAPTVISAVSVSGVEAPVTGATADTIVTCGEGYKVKEIVWVDTTGEYAEWEYGITEFKAGREYTVQITIEALDGYELRVVGGYTEITGTINGKDAIVYGSHSEKEVAIGFEFPATEAGAMHKHSPGEWTVVKAAEIGVEGKEQKTCTECGEVLEERVIPALKNPDEDIMLGDVNKDGKITAADARLALRISATLVTPTDYQKKAADMNGDGKITAADARKILRKSAQLE